MQCFLSFSPMCLFSKTLQALFNAILSPSQFSKTVSGEEERDATLVWRELLGIRGENPRILSASQIMFKNVQNQRQIFAMLLLNVWHCVKVVWENKKYLKYSEQKKTHCGCFHLGVGITVRKIQGRVVCWKYIPNCSIKNWHLSTPRIALFVRPLVGDVLYPI